MSAIIASTILRKFSEEIKFIKELGGDFCWISFRSSTLDIIVAGETTCRLSISMDNGPCEYDGINLKLRTYEFTSLLEVLSKNKKIKLVTIVLLDNEITVSSDNTNYTMKIELCSDISVPACEISTADIIGGAKELSAIKKSIDFCEKSKSSMMSGILYSINDGMLTIASTDSMVIHEYKDNFDHTNAAFIIQSKIANAVPKNITAICSVKDGVELAFLSDCFTAKTLCISGKYPKYDIILKGFDTDCIILLEDIKNAINEIREIASKDDNTKIRLSLEKGTAEMSVRSDTILAKSSFRYTPEEVSHRFLISLDKLKKVIDACDDNIDIGVKRGMIYLKSGNTRFAIALMN